jgi:hypothetical protein
VKETGKSLLSLLLLNNPDVQAKNEIVTKLLQIQKN